MQFTAPLVMSKPRSLITLKKRSYHVAECCVMWGLKHSTKEKSREMFLECSVDELVDLELDS